jgi:hypothetical protein
MHKSSVVALWPYRHGRHLVRGAGSLAILSPRRAEREDRSLSGDDIVALKKMSLATPIGRTGGRQSQQKVRPIFTVQAKESA